ncbi:MAG: hypothetical protein IBJ15_18150 [Alphaproteobacteria bacterium]|nr:hypothetical protein [Alphaproteobacteria bacterium]
MPTDAETNFKAVAENWFSVMNNYYADMAATQTAEQAKAVEDNYRAAEKAYLDAVAAGLAGAGMSGALKALQDANAAVKESREKAESIEMLLGKAKTATEKATNLVTKASG